MAWIISWNASFFFLIIEFNVRFMNSILQTIVMFCCLNFVEQVVVAEIISIIKLQNNVDP